MYVSMYACQYAYTSHGIHAQRQHGHRSECGHARYAPQHVTAYNIHTFTYIHT
jgi:hypothetical protein